MNKMWVNRVIIIFHNLGKNLKYLHIHDILVKNTQLLKNIINYTKRLVTDRNKVEGVEEKEMDS